MKPLIPDRWRWTRTGRIAILAGKTAIPADIHPEYVLLKCVFFHHLSSRYLWATHRSIDGRPSMTSASGFGPHMTDTSSSDVPDEVVDRLLQRIAHRIDARPLASATSESPPGYA